MEIGQVFAVLLKRKKLGTAPCEQNMCAEVSALIVLGCCPQTGKMSYKLPLSVACVDAPTQNEKGRCRVRSVFFQFVFS